MNRRKKLHRLSLAGQEDELDDTPLFTRIPSIRLLSRVSMDESVFEEEVVEEQETEIHGCLSYFNASLFATVLEDAVTQLRILAECNNELRISKTKSDMHELLLHKYNVKHEVVKGELEGIDQSQIHCDNYKLDKLANDRCFCATTILSTYLDLALKRDFDTIIDINKTRKEKENYYNNLLEDEAKNKIIRRELNKQVRQQRYRQQHTMYQTDVNVENIRSHLEDALMIANIRERYLVNWQVARSEQNVQTINTKEATSSNNISFYRKRLENETRVHSEVELLTTIHITETLYKVEEWMDKYDADIERMDLKIQLKKNDYKSKNESRMKMEKTLAEHDVLMKNWVTFKEEREALRQYQMKMTNAATVVQAWWRGILVRLHLGPFKPKKKGAGGKKKK